MSKHYFKNYALLAIGLIISITSYFLYEKSKTINVKNTSERIEKAIEKKINQSEELLEEFDFKALDNKQFTKLYDNYVNSFEDQGMLVAAYSNRKLSFWSSNLVPIPLVDTIDLRARVIRLDNGWYLLSKAFKNEHTAYVFSLIKSDYLYENKYLVSSFHKDFNFPFQSKLTTDQSVSGIPVELDDAFLFTVVINKNEISSSKDGALTLPLLYSLGLICITIFLYQQSASLIRASNRGFGLIVFIIPIAAFRFWMLQDQAPSILYDLEIFSPALYAQSALLSSLGDLLINVVIAFLFSYLLYRMIKSLPVIRTRPVLKFAVLIAGFVLLFSIAAEINSIFSGLVINSQINYEIGNVFDLNEYSFIGILIIGLLLFTFFILCAAIILFYIRSDIKQNQYYFIFSLICFVYLALSIIYTDLDLLEILWPIFIQAIVGIIILSRRISFSFAPVVGLILINSLVAAHIILKYSSRKEIQNRVFYAKYKLAYDEDWDAEILYAEMEEKLAQSDVLAMPFNDSDNFNKAEFDHILETDFFNGHWDKYDIAFNLFDKDSLPVGLSISSPKDFEELTDIITRSGIPSSHNPNIYQIPNYDNKLSYITHLVIPGNNAEPAGHLFCELKSKKLPKDIGFPELLIDKNTKTIEALAGYSFARYLDSNLIVTLGLYNYSITPKHIKEKLGSNKFLSYNENGYNHLAYRVNRNVIIVIGKPEASFLEKATSFSYLFALFSLLLLVAVAIKELRRITDLRRLTLKSKIQLVIIGLILTCLILFGLGTRFFIERQYNDKNNKLISEKIRSVNVEVKKKLSDVDEISPSDYNFINSIMHKFSLVFFTDINMYDKSGTLIASSRHELFNAGLLGRKLHPKAYIELSDHNRSEFVQEESIGRMVYLSAYVPYVSDNGEVLGYLNLPYFAKQNPLENEISNFLVAIINIFVVLFALSIVAALFVSNWVTKPLRFLQTSVSSIELGKSNKPIEYTGQDEIGDLVQEYNHKVAELENAVAQLARTERESAWRDMAKQVAHEIKNPLTPMKLSVQHFQRSFDKDDPNAQERIERFAKTLIDQIETLTNIANEFSSFAKMPAAKVEDVDLTEMLEHTVDLFKEADRNDVTLENPGGQKVLIRFDKDQLQRVFNNLIKNALQAIPHNKENGHVRVFLVAEKKTCLIEVRDNGSGIPADKLDQIFVPNFTTKSKGMGLGLSMVKSIVNNAGGDVWFETKEDEGTSFFVRLPKL